MILYVVDNNSRQFRFDIDHGVRVLVHYADSRTTELVFTPETAIECFSQLNRAFIGKRFITVENNEMVQTFSPEYVASVQLIK